MITTVVAVVTAAFLVTTAHALYLPHVDYTRGQPVLVFVNSMHSFSRPSEPMDYYWAPHCGSNHPAATHQHLPKSVAELLMGEDLQTSPYAPLRVLENVRHRALCPRRTYNETHWDRMREVIARNYRVRLMADKLPNVYYRMHRTPSTNPSVPETIRRVAVEGYYFGDSEKLVPYTHVDITMDYHVSHHDNATNTTYYRIVGFETTPSRPAHPNQQSIEWTYAVHWRRSDLPYASRFDVLMQSRRSSHGYSVTQTVYLITCGVILTAAATFMSYVYIKSMRAAAGNDGGGDASQPGWKAVSQWVFRRPRFMPRTLCALVATGTHVATVVLVNALIGLFGLLYIDHRGALLQTAIASYVVLTPVNGYVAARLHQTMRMARPFRTLVISFGLYPFIVVGLMFVINQVLAHDHSTAVIHPWTAILFLAIALLFSLVLTVFGFSFGMRHGSIPLPGVATAAEDTGVEVPAGAMELNEAYRLDYRYRLVSMRILFSLVSFGVISVALVLIYQSIWSNRIYTLFSVLGVAVLAWFAATQALTMIYVYQQLNWENPDWWWGGFLTGATVSVWVFILSVVYYFTSMMHSLSSLLIYFMQILLICATVGIVLGTVSFIAAAIFVWRSYSAIKTN